MQDAVLLVFKEGTDFELIKVWIRELKEKEVLAGLEVKEFDASETFPTIYFP